MASNKNDISSIIPVIREQFNVISEQLNINHSEKAVRYKFLCSNICLLALTEEDVRMAIIKTLKTEKVLSKNWFHCRQAFGDISINVYKNKVDKVFDVAVLIRRPKSWKVAAMRRAFNKGLKTHSYILVEELRSWV